jgi:hypothetical protein
VTQRTRILIAIAILLVLVAAVVGIEALRRSSGGSRQVSEDVPTTRPGDIPIYLDGEWVGAFNPPDLEALEMVSFVEAEEGKTEEGWLLSDVLRLHVEERALQPDTVVVVSSSSREKSAQLTWAEVDEPANWVMFDLSGRGTLKLVSVLERLDTRDEWVQDVDLIELTSP